MCPRTFLTTLVYVAKNKGADHSDQLRSYWQLICVFVFTYAKSRFSHDAAHMVLGTPGLKCMIIVSLSYYKH